MARFKRLNDETMHWLDKASVMISFRDGVAKVDDQKQIKEMKSHGYVDMDEPPKSTPKKQTK